MADSITSVALYVLIYGSRSDDIMYFTCFRKAVEKLQMQHGAILYEYIIRDGVFMKTKHSWHIVDGALTYIY